MRNIYDMANIREEFTIIFGNSGRAVLVTEHYQHTYDDMHHFAHDVNVLLEGGDTDDWDDNEKELSIDSQVNCDDTATDMYCCDELIDFLNNTTEQYFSDTNKQLFFKEFGIDTE